MNLNKQQSEKQYNKLPLGDDFDLDTNFIELQKEESITEEGYYHVNTGAVVLIAKGDIKAAAIGVYYRGDVICVSDECWAEALIYSSVFKVDKVAGLETRQFADACIRELDKRSLNTKEIVYNLLVDFTINSIAGVNIVKIAKILGITRETVGKNINELIAENRVIKIAPSYWKTV